MINTQALPRGSVINPNKSPTPTPKSHLLDIKARSRISPGLPQHFLITEKRQDSSLSLRSIHNSSKKELAFPSKQPTLRLQNSPSRLALNESLSIMNSPSHASLTSSTRNNNVSSERLKRIDDHVNRQKNMKIKKEILKKVFAEATSPMTTSTTTPKYTKFLGFLDDSSNTSVNNTMNNNTPTPIHSKAPQGYLRIIKKKPTPVDVAKNGQQPEQALVMKQSKENEPEDVHSSKLLENLRILKKKPAAGKADQQPEQASVMNQSKENEPEEDRGAKLLEKNHLITSSTDLHKSVRLQYLFEPDSATTVKNSLGVKIKPFILEGFDPNTVKYNNIFVSKVYKKPRPVLIKKGSAQSQGSSDSQPGSKTNLEEKTKREGSLEKSMRRVADKEQSFTNLLEEMKSTNIKMSKELEYRSIVPEIGERKERLADKYLLFHQSSSRIIDVGHKYIIEDPSETMKKM